MAREDGTGLRLLFPATDNGTMAKAHFKQERHKQEVASQLASLIGSPVEIEIGELETEEQGQKPMLDLSKIKMPVTFE